jgi:pyridoxal phosphate enzyme (YggS family)
VSEIIGKPDNAQAMTDSIQSRLEALKDRMAAACRRAHRPPGSVALVAISKTVPASRIAKAMAAGQRRFGESYLQEALPKIAALRAQGLFPQWHFIGPLQSNKTRAIAEHFSWVHAVDRLKIAERLSVQRPEALPPLDLCVQVNVSAEASKSGCTMEEAARLCSTIAALPRLRLRGLMAIPAPAKKPESSRPAFRLLGDLFATIRQEGLVDPAVFDTLSMGMSDDFEIAIEEGATLVRIGSALFGPRGAGPGGTCPVGGERKAG